MTTRSEWMLYGAYGSTGRLILDEALRRGHRPVLAGRDLAQLSALGQATGLRTMQLPLDDGARLRAALSHMSCVLLAAGPYSLTGRPMRAACLDAGCSYLDINGEIEDFHAALSCDAEARRAGVAVLAGVGYGVVFGGMSGGAAAARVCPGPPGCACRSRLAPRPAASAPRSARPARWSAEGATSIAAPCASARSRPPPGARRAGMRTD